LEIADVPGLRPTADRVRETLFNWLAPTIDGARCLDLFAGTGAIGLEALSRGAASVVFVENSQKAADALIRNFRKLKSNYSAVLKRQDAFEYLRQARKEQFDLVFIDPPFDNNGLEEACSRLAESGVLAPGASVYLEEDRLRRLPALPEGWVVRKERTAGNVRYALVTTTTA
jgi:16S rRNA (guanine966-N2)-methyltransferase